MLTADEIRQLQKDFELENYTKIQATLRYLIHNHELFEEYFNRRLVLSVELEAKHHCRINIFDFFKSLPTIKDDSEAAQGLDVLHGMTTKKITPSIDVAIKTYMQGINASLIGSGYRTKLSEDFTNYIIYVSWRNSERPTVTNSASMEAKTTPQPNLEDTQTFVRFPKL